MRDPVLGLGGSNHDFSAAIVSGGAIQVAIEDERIQRIKRGQSQWYAKPAHDAAEYCLAAAQLDLEDLAGVFCNVDIDRPADWLDWSRVTFVNHHTAHAAASFFTSPHREAALLVVDGHGSPIRETESAYEVETISVGWAEGTDLTLHALETGTQRKTSNSWRHIAQNSIGWFYGIVTRALGLGDAAQGKTMGLAAYGTPKYLDALKQFVDLQPSGRFRFDPYGGIYEWLADTLASQGNAMQVRADVAYAAQEIFVDAIVAAADEAYRQAPSPALCFGGGCALNTLANSRILEATRFEQIWVFPAAGDNGLSVGAALYGAHSVLGQARLPQQEPGWRARTVYTGRESTDEEIDTALADAPVAAAFSADLVGEISRGLADGETVAVCRGRSEIGPRALGNRSLLALPVSARMRDHVNLNIKQRESFRPLAPVVPIEHASTYFEGIEESPYMLMVATVRPEAREDLAAVTHIDGTARVQTVRAEDNPFLHDLLERIGERTGVPVLLNTSLNLRGEPIVETPADAVGLFLRCPIDLLLLGDRIVRKCSPWAQPPPAWGPSPTRVS